MSNLEELQKKLRKQSRTANAKTELTPKTSGSAGPIQCLCNVSLAVLRADANAAPSAEMRSKWRTTIIMVRSSSP